MEVESGNDISVVKWSNNCIFILTNHFSLIPQIINEYCDKKEDKEKTNQLNYTIEAYQNLKIKLEKIIFQKIIIGFRITKYLTIFTRK